MNEQNQQLESLQEVKDIRRMMGDQAGLSP
jgi:hypothetical protein